MFEQRRRTILRAVSWRITATLTTTVISYLITGSLDIALAIGGVELVTKLMIHYFHERLWMKIKYGIKPPEYQI